MQCLKAIFFSFGLLFASLPMFADWHTFETLDFNKLQEKAGPTRFDANLPFDHLSQDVLMDDWRITSVTAGQNGLSTAGVATCIAYCLSGYDSENRLVQIGLAHDSGILEGFFAKRFFRAFVKSSKEITNVKFIMFSAMVGKETIGSRAAAIEEEAKKRGIGLMQGNHIAALYGRPKPPSGLTETKYEAPRDYQSRYLEEQPSISVLLDADAQPYLTYGKPSIPFESGTDLLTLLHEVASAKSAAVIPYLMESRTRKQNLDLLKWVQYGRRNLGGFFVPFLKKLDAEARRNKERLKLLNAPFDEGARELFKIPPYVETFKHLLFQRSLADRMDVTLIKLLSTPYDDEDEDDKDEDKDNQDGVSSMDERPDA